jgi:hypothetical protein
MPSSLVEVSLSGHVINISWSNDWTSRTPWLHFGEPMSYVTHRAIRRDELRADVFYLGPLAVTWAHRQYL